MKQYVFERFSEESRRLINQTGVKATMIQKEGNEDLNAAWDGFVAPDGAFYYPLSSECGLHGTTKLGKYDFATNTVTAVLDGRKVLMPIERQLPHSKFHTSLNAIPRKALFEDAPEDPEDFLIVGTTHSTDSAPHHSEWMPFGHHNDPYEGYPGSQIVVYDPKNGHAWSMGVPVPHESIYGAKYDPKHNRLYMIGFMRGHVYCFDFAQRKVIKDLGKVAEVFCYRLSLGADGNLYGCSKSGQLFKVNTETVELENMAFHVPDYPDNFVSYTWYRYLVVGRNHPSGKFMYMAFSSLPVLHKMDYATGEVTEVGSAIPMDGLYELPAKDASWGIRGFDMDKYGVLWLIVSHSSVHNETPYNFPKGMYLIRWDVERGEKPYCCGLVGTEEYYQECVSEMEIDQKGDILYFVNTATNKPLGLNRPMAGGIDLSLFREHYKEPGPVCRDDYLDVYELTPEEVAERNRKIDQHGGEENAVHNPFAAFDPLKMTPVRIWRSLPRLEVEQSKVIGMAFDPDKKGEDYLLHVVCGEKEPVYVLQIAEGKVQSIQKFSEISEVYKAWLTENILPRPVEFDSSIQLPEVTGRRYRAYATATAPWKDGKQFVGTRDALLALVSPNGGVYSFGNAASCGPIRAMVTNKDRTHLWGVAGDDEDLGYIFQYDESCGLRQMGIINYNTYGYYDGPVAANVLSSITLSADETYLAVGSADRIAMVAIVKL